MRLLTRPKHDGHDKLVEQLTEAVYQREESLDLLVERLAELELALEDEGWVRLGFEGQREFSRGGLRRICAMSRLMYLKNPLIQRAVNVKTYYVWGQGVNITARDEAVNDAIQRFLDDDGNKDALTGHAARMLREVDLECDGNLFLTLFPNDKTGHVKVRAVDVDEITDIVTNPEDRSERWFYKREWNVGIPDKKGSTQIRPKVALYPDWRYRPNDRVPQYQGYEVRWDSPMYHVRVGGLGGMRFGVPETYAALDWARAYKGFLEDWATLVRSLSRFAWRMTTEGRKVASAKKKLSTTVALDNLESNPPPLPGSVFVQPDGTQMEPIPKTGATTSADDGRNLRLMVASSMDLPDTILAGDPDMGNLATAKTLDRPTELAMRTRQTMWADVLQDLCRFVIRSHVLASSGMLVGDVNVDDDGIETITLRKTGDTDPDLTVEVTFPGILEHDVDATVTAIVKAATLNGQAEAGTLDKKTLVRLLLNALGVDNIDELVEDIADEMEKAAPTGPAEVSAESFSEALRDLRAALVALRENA